jgi:zinc-ribbon domain
VSLADRIRSLRPRRAADGPPEGLVPAARMAAQARRDAVEAHVDEADRELLAERDRLTERFAVMQSDLGGVFYEMAIRDHVRMDVLTRKAAELQRVDAQLAEVERALRGEDGPATGICPECGARHGAGARFCSRCGHSVGSSGNGSAP